MRPRACFDTLRDDSAALLLAASAVPLKIIAYFLPRDITPFFIDITHCRHAVIVVIIFIIMPITPFIITPCHYYVIDGITSAIALWRCGCRHADMPSRVTTYAITPRFTFYCRHLLVITITLDNAVIVCHLSSLSCPLLLAA